MGNAIYLVTGSAILALVYAFMKSVAIGKEDAGTDKMKEIATSIKEGAMAFLSREYKVLAIFVAAVSVLLFLGNVKDGNGLIVASFICGAVCSGLAGYFGMRIATTANVRTTNAARKSLNAALAIAFGGGSVMGMCVVGLGILGLSVLFIIYTKMYGVELGDLTSKVLPILSGFSLGASSIALFARVGGGIYTKAADVGADLVGKVEAGIPEDDPRNPAVIADNVGDNVGDVAGMGADLFESYVGAIIGAMVLGAQWHISYVLLPLYLAAVGIVVSIAGTFLVRTKEGGNPQTALNMGSFGAAILTAIISIFVIKNVIPADVSAISETAAAAGGIIIATFTRS